MWSTNASPVHVTPFNEQAGPKVPLPSDPLGLFSLFFDNDLISLIVKETNRYAEQALQGKNEVWSTDTAEIRAYLGFTILMGINQLPEIRDYWSSNEYLRYAPIADKISRNRFEQITRYLHFVDNTSLPSRGQEGYSRLQKVEPVISAMKANCKSAYYPHCQVSIDEAMIPFKGRSTMKQYLPMKPVKRGFKVWVMADALNGYFYDFDVYVGATGEREGALGEKVVMRLSEAISGRHHQVYFDNYFTSIPLLVKLLAQDTYECGTIRTNRKQYPKEISEEAKRLRRGEFLFRQSGNIVAVAWKDNKVVNVVSTLANADNTTTVNRTQKDGTRLTVPSPRNVALYNEYMGGVDHGDHLRGSYRIRLKCMKNYKYVFGFLFDVAITNAYILYSRFDVRSDKPMDHKTFRMVLAEQLIGSYKSKKRAGRPRKRPHPSNTCTSLPHLPAHSSSKRCMYCKQHRTPPRRKESVWYCGDCDGHPPLCLTGRDDGSDCFRLWHQL